MFRSSFLFALLALLAMAPAAWAQHTPGYDPVAAPRRWHVGIGGGMSVPINDARDGLENGFNGLAYLRVTPIGVGLSLGVSVTYSKLDFPDVQWRSAFPGINGGNSQVLSGLWDVKFDLMHLGAVTPYITAGAGAYHFRNEFEGASNASSITEFGINGGAGLSIALGRSISMFVQGRVDNVYPSSRVFSTDAIQMVPFSAGIEY